MHSATQPDDFAPAYYAGHGTLSFWHRDPDCPAVRHGRRLGAAPMRSRVGAMKASGRQPCPRCTSAPPPTPAGTAAPQLPPGPRIDRSRIEWGTIRRLGSTVYAVTCRACGREEKGVFSNNATTRATALEGLGWLDSGPRGWRCPKHAALAATATKASPAPASSAP